MLQILIAVVVVMLGGVALSLQAPVNSALAKASGSGVFSAAVSFLVGFLALAIIVLLRGHYPSVQTLQGISPWMWAGGVLGAFYVWAALSNVDRIGVLTMVAALVCGQLLAALLLDTMGFAGIEPREISIQRVIAVFLVAMGLLLSRY